MIKVYRPIKTNIVSQKWGESKACGNSKGQVVGKRKGQCPIGYTDLYKSLGLKGHNGFDFAGIKGEGVYHCFNFTGIVRTETDKNGGLGIDVISKEKQILKDGTLSYIKVRYWHNDRILVSDGDIVRQGELIGLCGSTGLSSASHVHMGMKRVEFLAGSDYSELKPQERYRTLDRWNGFYGAIDFTDYYENVFIGDHLQFIKRTEALLIKLKRQLLILKVIIIKRTLRDLKDKLGSALPILKKSL